MQSVRVFLIVSIFFLTSCGQRQLDSPPGEPGEQDPPGTGSPDPEYVLEGSVMHDRIRGSLADIAASMSARSFPGKVDHVYLADPVNQSAYAIAAFAAAADAAPLFPIERGAITSAVAEEIQRLEPERLRLVAEDSTYPAGLDEERAEGILESISPERLLDDLNGRPSAKPMPDQTVVILHSEAIRDITRWATALSAPAGSHLVAASGRNVASVADLLERYPPGQVVIVGPSDGTLTRLKDRLTVVGIDVTRVTAPEGLGGLRDTDELATSALVAPADESELVATLIPHAGSRGAVVLTIGADGRMQDGMGLLRSTLWREILFIGDAADREVAEAILETRRQAIESENEQVVAITRKYDPEHASIVLRGHAVAAFGGCTGTWIGPNTLITAAHCGGSRSNASRRARMEMYIDKNLDQTASQRTDYTCVEQIASGWAASAADLSIWRCNSIDGVAPGDRFGWVDYDDVHGAYDDVSIPGPPKVYSVWFNPVDDQPNWKGVRLYSEGEVTSTTAKTWAVPNCTLGVGLKPPHGHKTSVWTRPGASGSLQFSPATHRAVIGPTSTGGSPPPRRWASSMAQMLNHPFGRVPGETYWVETFIDPAGSSPSVCGPPSTMQNRAQTDANADLVFDVHASVDDQVTNRPIYNLDFNTGWRRILWDTGPTFDRWQFPYRGSSRPPEGAEPWQVYARGNGAGVILRHTKLNLDPEKTYDIRVEYAATQESSESRRLKVGLDSDSASCPFREQELTLPAPRGAQKYTSQTYTLTATGCTDAALDVWISTSGIEIRRIIVAEQGATWDFESWDTREPWSQDRYGHALIYENGDPATGVYAANLVGVVPAAQQIPVEINLTSVPLRPAEEYRMSFKARVIESGDGVGNTFATISAASSSDRGQNFPFSPTNNWKTFTFDLTTANVGDNALSFIMIGRGQIAIDDVQFVRLRDL